MKPTLGQVFTLSLLGLGAVLALLFYIVFRASGATIIESSEQLREGASREIERRVNGFLAKAPEAAEQFQVALHRGLVEPRQPAAIERALLAPLLTNEDIGEITLTYGEMQGFDTEGEIVLASASRGQLSVWRTPGPKGEDHIWSRHTHMEGDSFVAEKRALDGRGAWDERAPAREPGLPQPDPTQHGTFSTPASEDFYGQLLWSDLHWSQLDEALPEPERRVEVSVQQVMTDADGKFVGVLRVGLLAQQLERAVELRLTPESSIDPHRIFLCDAQGRLIARGEGQDRFVEDDGDLRVAPGVVPVPIKSALAEPKLRTLTGNLLSVSGQFHHDNEEFLTTYRYLPGTQGWIAGIVVPRAFYLGKLTAMRDRLLLISLGLSLAMIAGGGLILRSVKRAQAQIERESLKLNCFDFSPAPTAAPFRDVVEVLESLEKAKTAMRAMGKYVPVDLVRRLYQAKSEPVLGGEPMEISIMFTDIKNFTTLSEELAPDVLAAALGRYLERMAHVIQQETRGTIDKYIGDAIMTLWNAPEPLPDHARQACIAALRCCEVGKELAQSPAWAGLPPFETRFGLHRDEALVGHFGAPDRMNYTAIGDAVNLASRLEGLNKIYGTSIIVSEQIVSCAGEEFAFRLLDLVAVKGKTRPVRIYELLGWKQESRSTCVLAYEQAFAAYAARDFAGAIAILRLQESDAPSLSLLNRCREYEQEPPAEDWTGIHIVATK